jgi:hypothetical protein
MAPETTFVMMVEGVRRHQTYRGNADFQPIFHENSGFVKLESEQITVMSKRTFSLLFEGVTTGSSSELMDFNNDHVRLILNQ